MPVRRGATAGVTERQRPALAEFVCLALIAEGAEHGWGIGTLLADDGDIGRIWTLSRPLTYRAIDQLIERGYVARRGTEQGRGRQRTLLRSTAAGRRAVAAWLNEPVQHLRDVRTELLVKLTLRQRVGLSGRPLIVRQQEQFADTIDALTSTGPDNTSRPGAEAGADDDLVGIWRRESARAVRRFLDEALDPGRRPAHQARPTKLRLSARNQLTGVVSGVTHGDVMSSVKLTLPDGQRLTAAITKDAATDLDLAPGDDVMVIVKSTEVIVAKPAG